MEGRNTPIERPPMLGFKQSKFYRFYNQYFNLEFQLISTCFFKKFSISVATTDASAKKRGNLFMMNSVEILKIPAQPHALEDIMRSRFSKIS